MRALLIFLDGVGLGDAAPYNPFTIASLPTLRGLLDGAIPLHASAPLHTARASLLALDATLGVAGTPQSGTGQTTMLTGRNAAELHGGHFGPWVPMRLRPMLRAENVLTRAAAAGLSAAFANAYPAELITLAAQTETRLPAFMRAGPVVAALGAGLLTRTHDELMTGNAVASEIVNDGWRDRLGYADLPTVTPIEAGERLARIASHHDLTFFAHYATDAVGHAKEPAAAAAALERVDAFLGGVAAAVDDQCMIVVASDHGNIEDTRTGHTRNPALGLVIGAGHAAASAGAASLLDVCPMLLRMIGV
jgi:2,3-bisphosphoglycerate-independent phosphoglycerate mutase